MPYQTSAVLLAVLAAMTLGGCATSGSHQITILHTNDMHGRHSPFHVAPGDATAQTGDPGRAPSSFDRSGYIGGFEYLAGAIRQVRERDGAKNVLLVDGGDTFGDDLLGNLTKGGTKVLAHTAAVTAAPMSAKSCVISSTSNDIVNGPPTTATAIAAMPISAASDGSTAGRPAICPAAAANI